MPVMIILSTFIVLNCFVVFNNGANILALFPMSSKSHTIIGYNLCETLAKRGHNVTHVSAFPRGIKLENYHEVNLIDYVNPFYDGSTNGSDTQGRESECILRSKNTKEVENSVNNKTENNDKITDWLSENIISQTHSTHNAIIKLTDIVLKDRNLHSILNSKQHFDVIIMGAFGQEALLGIGHHLNAPIIVTAPPGMSMFVDDFVGNPAPFSYVPNLLFDYTDKMTFFQRLTNTVYGTYVNIYRHFVYYPTQNELLHKYFPHAPDVKVLMINVAIILSNSHESIGYPRPLVPNVINVAGLHVLKPQPLSNCLQTFMDDTEYEGVIYLSLGSNFHSKDMPKAMKDSFVQAFAKLKSFKVLWKWDEPTIEGLTDNVRLRKWFPQSDVLAHPKTKLFITHGGLLSTIETVVRGVPLIGIPLFADQFITMKRAKDLDLGVILDYQNITEESVTEAINEILNNKKYYKNIKQRSEIINDQIVHPLDKAVYWVEYVIRHKGAAHLRSAGADIQWYQYLLIDVIGFILIILSIILTACYLIIKKSFLYFKKSVQVKKTSKLKKQ